MYLYELKQLQNIAILGFGREGKSTLQFLLRLGISKNHITILDKNPISLPEVGVNIVTGGSYLDNLENFDLIFKTPGISPYNEKIRPYINKLTSQTEVFFKNYEGKTIGVTGTKGKSTISTLIYKTLINAQYQVKLVGNIGQPVFDEIDLLDPEHYNYVIYELSSYMLETCKPHCNIAIIGNIYTCHLDWHNNDFDVYKNAKLNIFQNSDNKLMSLEFLKYLNNKNNIYIFGPDSQYTFDNEYFYKNENQLFPTNNILLPGEHNKYNITCVIAVLDIITQKYNHGSNWIFSKLIRALCETLQSFGGLPHRLEKVATYNNITFIDDGISTTPESTIEAIKSYKDSINTIFLGGGNYGFTQDSYQLLRDSILQYDIKNIVLFPDTGLDIFKINKETQFGDEFLLELGKKRLNILYTNKMKDAVSFAYKYTGSGICLMSCAAPSYSLWSGYEEKGKDFKACIEAGKN